MKIGELWSQKDESELSACREAIDRDDLSSALLAIEGAPTETAAACHAWLDAAALSVKSRAPDPSPTTAHDALRDILVGRHDLRGDTTDYYHPRNSRLSEVVERRRGLPILVTAVWMLVGRRAGVMVDGIAMPGHFIARVGGPAGVLVDAFGGGRSLSKCDCQDIIRKLSNDTLPWCDGYLKPTTTQAMVERVLRNLVNTNRYTGDPVALFRPLRFLSTLSPDATEARLEEAVLAEELGGHSLALATYERLVAQSPISPEAQVARERLALLRRKVLRLH